MRRCKPGPTRIYERIEAKDLTSEFFSSHSRIYKAKSSSSLFSTSSHKILDRPVHWVNSTLFDMPREVAPRLDPRYSLGRKRARHFVVCVKERDLGQASQFAL